jgi:hypothetical protein
MLRVLDESQKYYKIGYTKRNVEKRIKELSTSSAYTFELVKTYPCSIKGSTLENLLHKQYFSKKIKGEWFELTIEDIINFEDTCDKICQNVIMLSESNIYFQTHYPKIVKSVKTLS